MKQIIPEATIFNDLDTMRAEGFEGFLSLDHLYSSKLKEVPSKMGIYLVVRLASEAPQFLQTSPAGHFKGKDPTVSVDELKRDWVSVTLVLNIGKAGDPRSSATLKSRLSQYLAFGSGCPVGHRGGRLIWQLADSRALLLGWNVLESGIPREVEKQLIRDFKSTHDGKRPFADLQD